MVDENNFGEKEEKHTSLQRPLADTHLCTPQCKLILSSSEAKWFIVHLTNVL